MASEVIAFPVNLRKNKNQYSPAYGKYFPEVDTKEPLNLKGFARHLSEHGKLVDYPMAVLVLQNIVNCLKEMIAQGQPVKLDGFGTFSPSLESDGKKVVDTVEGSLNVGLETLIAGVHLRFMPENTKGEKLTSRALKDECTFKAAYVIESKKKVVDGKERSYQVSVKSADKKNPPSLHSDRGQQNFLNYYLNFIFNNKRISRWAQSVL